MIKVYVLSSNVEEISHKGFTQITDEEFKLFGRCHTIEEFEHALNFQIRNSIYNQSVDHIRFIETGEELLLLNKEEMPKNE